MALGSALALVGATAASGLIGSKASKKAAKAQVQAAQESAAVQKYIYDTTREDYKPYRDVGYGALGKLAGLYGIDTGSSGPTDYAAYVKNSPDLLAEYKRVGGQFGSMEEYGRFHWNRYGQSENRSLPSSATSQPGAGRFDDFYKSPDYQFRLQEGEKAINRAAAARGLWNSGATIKSLDRFNQGEAAGAFDTYANRLASLAGVGQTATSAVAQAGQQYANGASTAYTNAGNARASGYQNSANSWQNAIQNVTDIGMYGFGGGFGK